MLHSFLLINMYLKVPPQSECSLKHIILSNVPNRVESRLIEFAFNTNIFVLIYQQFELKRLRLSY